MVEKNNISLERKRATQLARYDAIYKQGKKTGQLSASVASLRRIDILEGIEVT